MDLSIECCGVKFPNPTVLASGVLGITASSWRHCAKNGVGGITTKSVWLEEHRGHPNPTMVGYDAFMLNAVGLPDAGIEKAREEVADYLKDPPTPLILNIVGGKKDEFLAIAEYAEELCPDMIELNISCPNVEDEFGKPFACSRVDAAELTRAVRERIKNTPLFVKLSPNAEDIVGVAQAVVDAGADGITAINTLGPGMVIDLETRRPVLANKVGGISGPAIKPLAVKIVSDIYRATGVPIIGTGGVTSGRDAIEMMMAGARLVGVGSAVYYRDVSVFKEICDEMEEWCEKEGVKDLEEIIGCVKL